MKRCFPLDVSSVHLNPERNSWLPHFRGQTEIPTDDHPGSFAYVRKHHKHEGVDLYANEGDIVQAVEDGVFLGFQVFTGEEVEMPWWNTTHCAIVQHKNFIAVYGEITPFGYNIPVGYELQAGNILGTIRTVLKKDKGRPMSMLHFEMYELEGSAITHPWNVDGERPKGLLDPTSYLIHLADELNLLSDQDCTQHNG